MSSMAVSFVNRVSELSLIEEAFSDLLNKEHLNTPIIDFYGVEGIGKTSILTKVIEKCDENKIPYIKAEADNDLVQFSNTIKTLIKKYTTVQALKELEATEPMALTRALLEQGPLVMLLDAIDTTNESQILHLENLLRELIIYNKLFVVLTSRRSISFEKDKSVARKLTTFAVRPLDRESTELYLNSIQFPIDPALRETIFEWTRGYPLAMNAMVQALNEGITPTQEPGKQSLMARIVERVIDQGLLASIKTEDIEWVKTTLNLLAVPRRFNLIIMQKLIERFEPELKLSNSLAYLTVPKRIAKSTGVIAWDMIKAGFAIDEPVRNILLLQLKIGQPERYYELNQFLAEINWQNASEAIGLDRIRYQREYLYHSANSVEEDAIPYILQKTVAQIIQGAEQDPDPLIQFQIEFTQDNELQDNLGKNVNIVQEMIYSHLAQQMRLLYEQEKDDKKRFRYLYDFFYYTVHNPTTTDKASLATDLKARILLLQEQEGARHILKLYEELREDDAFVQALGSEFTNLHALLRKDSDSSEE